MGAYNSLTVAVLSDAVRRRVCDEHDHLARAFSPIHVKSLGERSRDGLRAIPAPRRIQPRQVFLDLADIRRKSEILRDIRVVLWWMISERNQADAEIIPALQLPRFKYVGADLFDVFRCR